MLQLGFSFYLFCVTASNEIDFPYELRVDLLWCTNFSGFMVSYVFDIFRSVCFSSEIIAEFSYLMHLLM